MENQDIKRIERKIDLILESASRPRWMSLTTAGKYADMCGKELLKLIKTGEIYGTRKGGKWRVDRESLDRYFEEDKTRLEMLLLKRRKTSF